MKAAVCYEFGAPLVVEDIELDSPREGEVKVDIAACAICHSDLSWIRGRWGGQTPMVAGHEAAGVVAAVGPGVARVRPGDRVVVYLRRSCGRCYYCARGRPYHCEGPFALDRETRLRNAKGQPLVQGLRTAAFAEAVVVDQSQVIAVAPELPLDRACLLACGVVTGVGAVLNAVRVEPGSNVVVVGTGGRRIPMARNDKRPRRQVLAHLLTRHENFSRVFVNRMWGHFFGKGLDGEFTVDDFGDNGQFHPIRDRLAQDFVTVARYDPKKLIRWICTSNAYQLQSTPNETNGEEHTDWLFSRMPLKPLSPDQLLESLLVATGPESGRDAKTRQKLLEQGLEALLDDVTEEDREQGWFCSVVSAVWLMNDPLINGAIARRNSAAGGNPGDAKQPLQTAEELYLATLNRYPVPKEVRRIEEEIDKIQKGGGKDLSPLWQDLQWALLNSNEFILNH
jgi:hypothetical protein